MHYDREQSGPAAPAAFDSLPLWDLSDLYAGPDDPALERDLANVASEAAALAERSRGRVATLDTDGLADLLERYEALDDRMGRIGAYAQLYYATRRTDQAAGRFYQTVQEKLNDASTSILFVTLEINRIEDADLDAKFAASERLARLRPWLRDVRAYRPHQLSDEAEQLLHEKHVPGRGAWVRLFDETAAGLRFEVEGKTLTSAEAFDLLSHKEREVRAQAYDAIAATLGSSARLMAHVTNTLAKDKQIDDRWRKFARPISARNLGNQVEDEVVDALIGSVSPAYPRLSHRYYQLKARWMGLERLEAWDRNAPLPEDAGVRVTWDEARDTVVDAYGRFSPKLAEIVGRFFERNWIDARVYAGKDSGAFCHPTTTSAHPYVLMNFQGRQRDVMTLAHELGHGVHQVLAAEQGPLMASTPLTLAETASVFGEQLTFQSLLERETDASRRRVLLAGKIEDALNTVVRQVAFCEFERRVHAARSDAELTVEELGEHWMAVQTESLGPAFRFDERYRTFWSYIPHFVHAPFYVYAYAFGDCLVNSLYAVYRERPKGFEPKYLEMLAAGGTLRHKELLAPFGLDASDPAFWDKGLGLIEAMIDRLEVGLED